MRDASAASGSKIKRISSSLLVLCCCSALIAGAIVISQTSIAGASVSTVPTPHEKIISKRLPAIISLGDSYISGDAGRWDGNDLNPLGNRGGSDRAAVFSWLPIPHWSYDPALVYGATAKSECYRSNVAEILSTTIDVAAKLNFACTGAVSGDITTNSFKGQSPQIVDLEKAAATYNVQEITLSIGGNDLGFSKVLTSCIARFIIHSNCVKDEQRYINGAMPEATTGIRTVINHIKAVMKAAGYLPRDYKIVLQDYPSPVSDGPGFRFPNTITSRSLHGCPLSNTDATWARTKLIGEIARNWQRVAQSEDVYFLNVDNAFAHHELCGKGVGYTNGHPNAAKDEWVRFLTALGGQGTKDESIHPDAFGQQALGTCLTKMWNQIASRTGKAEAFNCTDHAGAGVRDMSVTHLAPIAA